MRWKFKKETPFFVFDPEGEGISYFATSDERDSFSKNCIDNYLDGGWHEDVIQVLGGKITHQATQTNRVDKPDELDDEGCDSDGTYWAPEHDYICRYELLPLKM